MIAEGETKTFRAIQVATHRPVLLHQLSSNPRSGRQLHLLALVLRYSSGLRQGSASPILEIEEQGDSVWVITEDLPEMANLWDWMERETAKKPVSETAPSTLAAVPPKEIQSPVASLTNGGPSAAIEEKTSLFGARLAAAEPSPVVELDAPFFSPPSPLTSEEKITIRPLPPPESEAGSVTAFFSAPPRRGPQNPGEDDAVPARLPGATGTVELPPQPPIETKDSTVRLLSPAGEKPLSASHAEDAAEARTGITRDPIQPEMGGEFTMIFGKPSTQKIPASSSGPAQEKERSASPSEKLPESTLIFQKEAPQGVASPAIPTPPTDQRTIDLSEPPSEFTMLFRRPPGSQAAGEQKPRFMGFTAPTQEKAKFIETDQIPAPLPSPAAETHAPPPVSPSMETPPKAPKDPGDFTMIFGSPEADSPDNARTGISAIPNFPTPREDDPPGHLQGGEFTQVFERPQPAHDLGYPSPASHEPGAFTRIFQIPVGSDLLTASESQTEGFRPAAPIARPPEPPARFPEEISVSAPPPVQTSASPGVGAGGGIIPAAPLPALKPSIPAMPKFEIPRAVPSAPPLAPSFAAPKAPALPAMERPKGAPGPSILPLILIFGGIALVAVLLVLFFVTKH